MNAVNFIDFLLFMLINKYSIRNAHKNDGVYNEEPNHKISIFMFQNRTLNFFNFPL